MLVGAGSGRNAAPLGYLPASTNVSLLFLTSIYEFEANI